MFQALRRLSTSSIKRADLISDLYLSEIKRFVPSSTKAAVDLKESFTAPKAPTKPAVETPVSVKEESLEASNQQWSAIVNSIDDPHYWSDVFEWEKDDGTWYPQRRYPKVYDEHH